MTTKVLVFDYDAGRLNNVVAIIRANFDEYHVQEFPIDPPNADLDATKIREFRTGNYDLIVGYVYGVPTAKECLKAYKEKTPGGRAVLYSDQDTISVQDFEEYKLANCMVKFGPQVDGRQRNNLVTKIKFAMQEKGISYWVSPLKTKEFWGALTAVTTGISALATAIIKHYTPSGP